MQIVGAIALLLPNAVYDLYKRKISLIWTLICGTGGLIWQIWMESTPAGICCSLVPGLILCLAVFFRPGSVGTGDVFVTGALGIWYGFGDTVWIIGIGCFVMSVFCVPLLLMGKIKKNSTFPMIPFLLAGTCIYWILCFMKWG